MFFSNSISAIRNDTSVGETTTDTIHTYGERCRELKRAGEVERLGELERELKSSWRGRESEVGSEKEWGKIGVGSYRETKTEIERGID